MVLATELSSLPVPEILQARQPRSEHRLQLLPIIPSHREVELQIVLDLLSSSMIISSTPIAGCKAQRLLARSYSCRSFPSSKHSTRNVADVEAVPDPVSSHRSCSSRYLANITQTPHQHPLVPSSERGSLTSPTLRRNRTQLHPHPMPRLLIMLQRMTVPIRSADLFPPAIDGSAGEAEPEVAGKGTVGAGGWD